MSIIPVLNWRWWSLILRQEDIWCKLPPEIAAMIHKYLAADDPIFIKQKHIPLVIDKPGMYIMVENITFLSDNKDDPCIHITAGNVCFDGKGNELCTNAIGILHSPPSPADYMFVVNTHFVGAKIAISM